MRRTGGRSGARSRGGSPGSSVRGPRWQSCRLGRSCVSMSTWSAPTPRTTTAVAKSPGRNSPLLTRRQSGKNSMTSRGTEMEVHEQSRIYTRFHRP
uniref:Uncharacterized protein n=1 Tax=Anguilla anguilla TaxID=7936 RepID=A0A0E9T6P8_ANGAN